MPEVCDLRLKRDSIVFLYRHVIAFIVNVMMMGGTLVKRMVDDQMTVGHAGYC